jgi:hypothetical protein
MTWKPAALLLLLALLCACAEGGTRGSGISTSVLGNVVSSPVATGLEPEDLGGIRVVVEGTHASATTAADGSFELLGPFDGMETMRFEPPGGGTAQLAINVPAAGTLTLNNVHLDVAQGTASVETQDVAFDGVVVSTDCSGGSMVMNSAKQVRGDVDNYIVDLETSTLEDPDGNEVPCAAVRAGQNATLSGNVYPNGTFGHCLIVLMP